MFFLFAAFHPRREIPQLAIIPIVREPHEQYRAIMDDHAAVIYHVLVHYWSAPWDIRMRRRLLLPSRNVWCEEGVG